MKLIHLGDLHLGKNVNDFSMIEDQRYILDQIVSVAEAKQIDAGEVDMEMAEGYAEN